MMPKICACAARLIPSPHLAGKVEHAGDLDDVCWPPVHRNDRGAGLVSPSDDGGFELFLELVPNCARSDAICA